MKSYYKLLFVFAFGALALFSCKESEKKENVNGNAPTADSSKIPGDSSVSLNDSTDTLAVKNKQSEQTPTINDITVNPELKPLAYALAGIKHKSNEKTIQTFKAWQTYAAESDKMWNVFNDKKKKFMKPWADTALAHYPKEAHTLFYPFSGPDFLYADMFFPNADTMILAALEPVGLLPDANKLYQDQGYSAGYLASVRASLSVLLSRSFFITKRMKNTLNSKKLEGTLPVLLIFIARSGYEPLNYTQLNLHADGTVSERKTDSKAFNTGVKIQYKKPDEDKVRTLYYFKANLNEYGIQKDSGVLNFAAPLHNVYSFVKSCSYCMHEKKYSSVRNFTLRKSEKILQDDTGVPLDSLDKDKWDVKLFGVYTGTVGIGEFLDNRQPSLIKAYGDSSMYCGDLPFGIGYKWRKGTSNLMSFEKKK